jgi:CheY-like chemotaxis protein
LELYDKIAADVPDDLIGDPTRLRQILINLVANAIKFTERGKVTVEVELVEGYVQDAVRELHFAIRDTGIGIPEGQQETIFGAFEQVDGSPTRKYGGTGLGLAITKQLVVLMGGRVWVESKLGHGSTFHFTVRFGCAKTTSPGGSDLREGGSLSHEPVAAATASISNPDFRSLHVLLAEDNVVNQRLALRMLEKRGHVVLVVNNGRDAVDLASRYGFDLALMDVQMPEMDGLQATAAIRTAEQTTGAHLPIVAMTAHALQGDEQRCLAAGMDGYMSKPVDARTLFATIEQVISR